MLGQSLQKCQRVVCHVQQIGLRRGHESLLAAVHQEAQQPVVVAIDIEQAQRLVVIAELAPRPDLEQLLEGADAAGQRQERIASLGHHHLALVHRLDDVQLGQAAVAEFAAHEGFGDHADRGGTGGERRVGDHAHQAGAPAAVDKLPAAVADFGADRSCGFGVGRQLAGARAAIHAD